jgi:TonB-dependent SusC/RagA subfamily outer membrane receptor
MRNDHAIKDGFVYGTVLDSERKPLSGVTVAVVGTTRGTITDLSGNYMVGVEKGEMLSFTFIGMNAVEAKVGRRNTIDVIMEDDVTQLSELVVTAGGLTVQRREFGHQVTTITAKIDRPYDFEEFNAMTGLSGRVPGLLVTSSSEGPDKDYRIVLRGQRSLTGNNQALYVVDGVIVSGMKVNEDDIASIEVLSGAAATSLYGSDGVNGVIIVTTVSGQRKLDEAMAKVNVRKNFNETAFFFPHLITNEMGRVRFTFTTPESLTRWKMQLLAHTDDLLLGESTLQAVTQKELMISPNVPRFLRVGDELTLSVKITNLSGQKKDGFATLQLADAVTGEPVDKRFGNIITTARFKIAARQNTEVSWKLHIPAGIDAVQYNVIAKAGSFGDGEQNIIPVLSDRIVVTETMSMNVRNGQSKTFSLEKLTAAEKSATLQHQRLTLEITSNPAWYAIRSLPFLMEYPHECAEQLFSRYYANALASHIVNSNPKIKKVFDQWALSGPTVSNLEKNPELKTILIQETPWLRDAQNETEQQKRIALLFDLYAINAQLSSVVTKLSDIQLGDGSFPWFSGGDPNLYITRHIVASYGHLRKLGVKEDNKILRIISRSIAYLDNSVAQQYSREEAYLNQSIGINRNHLDNAIVHYLYMRSFFPEIPLPPATHAAVDYYLRQQGIKHWTSLDLYAKGMLALAQFRNNNLAAAKDILNSLRENSTASEELGMYWKENKGGWYWHQAAVETQALLIEAFAEIESADKAISPQVKQATLDELRVWLLKNKQTSQWKTTRATTEAI